MGAQMVAYLLIVGLLEGGIGMGASELRIEDLRCEYRVDPAGIDTVAPRLSWRLVSNRRGAAQSAYHVVVATRPDLAEDGKADLWDSGRITSDQSLLVVYGGGALESRQRCYWRVRVWDETGRASAWSETARWSMGLLRSEDWKGKWIGWDVGSPTQELESSRWIWMPEGDRPEAMPVGTCYFRRTIEVPPNKAVDSARAVFAADNAFQLFVNGEAIGGSEDYQLASEFDITDSVRSGANLIAISATNRGDAPNPAGLIGFIEVNFTDAARETFRTDAGWRASSDIPASWTEPEFDDSQWRAALDLGPFGMQPWGAVSVPSDRRLPARMLRRTLRVDKPVRSAFVYMSGLGLSELYVNGQRVGDHVLSPALSEYDKRVYYVTHEVTTLLRSGANAIGVLLGNGRFYAPRGSSFVGMRSYGYPKLLLQVHVEFEDGTTQTVVTDELWKLSTDGPIRANNEFDGEEYDARMEIPAWAGPDFDDSAWRPAKVVEPPGGVLTAQMIQPIRVVETVKPRAVHSPKPGVYVVDMGQNLVGWCRIRVKGPRGSRVRLRHAETLREDGNLYVANLRSAKAAAVYILKGDGEEVYEPRFAYYGFRYVEVRGYPGTFDLSAIEAKVVHDDVTATGEFACSNETINRIYRNAVWGIRGNYRSVPTDCPQRDERQGWLGDRSEESRGEMYLFDLALLYGKWVQDMEDAQRDTGSVPDVAPSYYPFYTDNVTWPSSFIIIPGVLYEKYGDIRYLERHYPAMQRWIEYMRGFMKNGLMPRDQYGDWCVPPESQELIHSKDPARKTAGELIASAYFYHDLELMAGYAKRLGKLDDETRYRALATELKDAFNRKYLDKKNGRYDNGTQTSCVLPLAFGMTPQRQRKPVFEHLTHKILVEGNGHIGTGLIGGQWLMRVLAGNGRGDIGYTIATQTDYPSWGYMIENGATTIWELWNGNTADPAMNSHNHVMLIGDFIVWLYEQLAGIQSLVDVPAYKRILLKPQPIAGLDFVRARYLGPYGPVLSHWRRDGNTLVWDLEIPPNATAEVHVPARDARSVREGGMSARKSEGVRPLRRGPGVTVFHVGSGRYTFQSELPPAIP